MRTVRFIFAALVAFALAASAIAQSARFTVSGEGVVGKDSVKAGKPFSLDLMLSNAGHQKAFTLGFVLSGKNGLTSISPVRDSAGDSLSYIKGYNGFDDASIWDFGKLQRSPRGWDGKLPDSLLVGGVSVNKGWAASEEKKYISVMVMAATAGTLCVDTGWIPPGGKWMYTNGREVTTPAWKGSYCVTVVGKKK